MQLAHLFRNCIAEEMCSLDLKELSRMFALALVTDLTLQYTHIKCSLMRATSDLRCMLVCESKIETCPLVR